jgi:sodium pump decarboxylase gamma subunit
MSEFLQAVNVTVLGMGLVFASLGLLMLIMMGLLWALRERPQPSRPPAEAEPVAPFKLDPEPEARQPGEVPGEVVAAIAVAVAVWKERQAAHPPQTTVVTFAPGAASWRALGRLS